MTSAIQPIPQSFVDEQKLRRILGIHGNARTEFPEVEFRVCGSGWTWVRDYQGRGWWVHLDSGRVLPASSQWGNEKNGR